MRGSSTLNSALKEAVRFGMIELTRHGGLNKASLYALTWKQIDDCRGKLDCNHTYRPSGKWKIPPEEKQNASSDLEQFDSISEQVTD